MKRKLAAFLLIMAVMLAMPMAAHAETLNGEEGWTVNFTADEKMESNFGVNAIDDTLKNMQPGDTANFKIALLNTSGKTVDWYMLNEIVKSLEDSTRASGGAYSYLLTYTDSAGAVTELYNSDTVGGEDSKAPEGLHEVDSNLKNYMFLERMQTGRTGTVNLKVVLEGESQGNIYQDTKADLRMRFAVEVVPTRHVVTGDEGTNLKPVYIGMAAAGILLLVLAIDGMVQNKKKKRGQQT